MIGWSIFRTLAIWSPIAIRPPIAVSHLVGTVAHEWERLTFFKVFMGFTEHPNRERKFEVWVRNRAILVEYTLDCLLRPRAILLAGHIK